MYVDPTRYDVLVVGAGHAGTEAALAAARLGASVALVTQNLDRAGWMSCNPAIGGLGKGHLVKEVDALGGVMARTIDRAGIQFRRLNTSKGPAVRASRAQADKWRYAAGVRAALEAGGDDLALVQGTVEQLVVDGGAGSDIARVVGVDLGHGLRLLADQVVITAGTFMGGLCHYGEHTERAGRAGDKAAVGLSKSLADLGLPLGRLKTGTVPRLDGRTIDWDGLERQPGDDPPRPFAMYGSRVHLPQVPCHITYTSSAAHDVIRANLHRSPMYSGVIDAKGPRYCPSIEDKVVRFADKPRHQIYLEPEGLDTFEVYPNGISTSLPLDVQVAMVRAIPGLERARIVRAGYAVEYDFVDPRVLDARLAVRSVPGLWLAGQVNGTTGYEEAAIQGLLAGANAALMATGRESTPLIVDRAEAYGGVLVDDLTTRGCDEPYRMFTSRAEHRLVLREDNADERLMPKAHALGLLDGSVFRAFEARMAEVEGAMERLRSTQIRPDAGTNDRLHALGTAPLKRPQTLEQLLRRPDVGLEHLAGLGYPWAEAMSPEAFEKISVRCKYAGYIARQDKQIARFRHLEAVALPSDLDYAAVAGLTTEACERLTATRPETVGQASRLRGVTPAHVTALLIHLRVRAKRIAAA